MTVLLLHLLKWQYQPLLQSASWRRPIRNQRLDIIDHLDYNPSLKPKIAEAIERGYRKAVGDAEPEIGLPEGNFSAPGPSMR